MDKDIFFQKFGHLAQGPDGIKKLRSLILQLAVQGKLVPQDPNDEPASVLLGKIASEKQNVKSSGRARKPKAQTDEVSAPLFDAPEAWSWANLEELSSYIQRGKGPKYTEKSNVPVVSQKCVQWSGFDITRARFVDEGTLSKYQDERFLRKNDLLWNSTGTGTIGRINVLPELSPFERIVADSHVTVVRLILMNPQYVWCYIASPFIQSELENNASGTTNQIELNTTVVKATLIPVPPLEEQKRIVAKVDELMAVCDELEARQNDHEALKRDCVASTVHYLTEATDKAEINTNWSIAQNNFHNWFDDIQTVKNLRATILQLAIQGKLVPQDPNDEPASVLLEKIADEKKRLIAEKVIKKPKPLITFDGLNDLKSPLPHSWEWLQFNDLAEIVRGGSPRPAGDPRFYDGEIPFLKVANITRKKGKFVEGYNATIKEAGLSKTRYIDKRTVLLSNSGATLGIPAICDFATTFNDGVAAFIEQSKYVYDEFLYLCLLNLSAWFLNVASRGQGQPNLNTDIIRATWVPLPPLAEQRRIVTKVDELMALCDQLETQIGTQSQLSQDLTASLIHHMTTANVSERT